MISVGDRGGCDGGDIDDGVKKEKVLFFPLTMRSAKNVPSELYKLQYGTNTYG